jgi:integrase
MASIDKRPDGSYRARYRERPGGPQRTQHFARKVDAERWLNGVRGDLARGVYVDPRAGERSFGDYARQWQAAQVHRPSTEAQVASNLDRHVLPYFGERPLGAIRPSEVQTWVKGRAAQLAPATVEVVYRYLVSIFRAAVDDRLIATSPCRGVRLPRVERRQLEPLTTEAVRALVDAMPDRYRALVVLAAGTGLRQGEAFGLTADRVDFLRRSLRVDRQLLLLPGAPPAFAPPKTGASYRTVPLPDVVLKALGAHLAAFEPGEDGLIFTDAAGRAIRRNRFGEVWRRASCEAGVEANFHDLRHYYASLLIRAGESVKVVQSRLGHASAAETLDTYSHLWPDSEDRTRAAVDAVLGRGAEDSLRTAETY